jgi:hypothetical protein
VNGKGVSGTGLSRIGSDSATSATQNSPIRNHVAVLFGTSEAVLSLAVVRAPEQRALCSFMSHSLRSLLPCIPCVKANLRHEIAAGTQPDTSRGNRRN